MYTENLNPAAIHLVQRELVDNRRYTVLEFGCWTGALGSYMTSNFNLNWFGVEKNKSSAAIASTRFTVTSEDASEYIHGSADWLLCSDIVLMVDVLEHLYEPTDFLKQLRCRMKPNSTLILVLPNIESYEIIELLISNNFSYSDSGILDRTHRYFYSPKSACSELHRLGFGLKSEPYFLRNERGMNIFDCYTNNGNVTLQTNKGTFTYPTNYLDACSVSSYGFGISLICQ